MSLLRLTIVVSYELEVLASSICKNAPLSTLFAQSFRSSSLLNTTLFCRMAPSVDPSLYMCIPYLFSKVNDLLDKKTYSLEQGENSLIDCIARNKLICYSGWKRGFTVEQHPFKWCHFEADVILLCIRWYVRRLSHIMLAGVFRSI